MRGWRSFAALGLVVMMFAAACGDDGGSSAGDGTGSGATGTANATSTTLTPQTGGIITVGQFSAPPGLDPAKLAGGGTVGGMELMALYDVLVRYNNVTSKYEPRTAESLSANADYSVWTLKLKSGLKFTDGTAYDAAAVKFVHDRELKEGNAAPKGQLVGAVKAIDVLDPLTVRYTLTQPWAGFPNVLAGVNGIIYSPAAYAKAGANFNTAPGDAGAGPFKLKSYKPGESIEFERNTAYYGGDVYLDGLVFKIVAGPAATYEAIKSNTFQAGFVRDPAVIAKAKEEKYQTVDMPAPAGNLAIMNSGVEVTCRAGAPANLCAGKTDGEKVKTKSATQDVRVRQAVAHAVEPKVINDRGYSGKAKPNSAPFANSPWDPKVEGPKPDAAEARRLIAEAKAAGWDGKIRVLAGNDPIGTAWAQAVAAQLQAVGMEVAVDTTKDTQGVVNQVLVQGNFDIATWALALLDDSDANYQSLLSSYGSVNKRYGYGSPDMDAAIDLLRVADTDAKRVEAYKKVSEIWIRDMPAHVITEIPQALIYSPKVHGPVRTAASTVLFDKAWIEK
jgi:peptide/nickel transport system substrate-binding protein